MRRRRRSFRRGRRSFRRKSFRRSRNSGIRIGYRM